MIPGPPLRGMSSPPATSITKICTSASAGLKIAVRLSPPLSTSTRSSGPLGALELGDRLEVGRDVVADRRVRAAAGLDGEDPVGRQHAGAAQEERVLGRVDVVRHDADRELVAERPAERRDERALAGADRAADPDPQRALRWQRASPRGRRGRASAARARARSRAGSRADPPPATARAGELHQRRRLDEPARRRRRRRRGSSLHRRRRHRRRVLVEVRVRRLAVVEPGRGGDDAERDRPRRGAARRAVGAAAAVRPDGRRACGAAARRAGATRAAAAGSGSGRAPRRRDAEQLPSTSPARDAATASAPRAHATPRAGRARNAGTLVGAEPVLDRGLEPARVRVAARPGSASRSAGAARRPLRTGSSAGPAAAPPRARGSISSPSTQTRNVSGSTRISGSASFSGMSALSSAARVARPRRSRRRSPSRSASPPRAPRARRTRARPRAAARPEPANIGRPSTGCGVGIEAFGVADRRPRDRAALQHDVRPDAEEARIPEHEVGELADLDRPDLARRSRARPPGRSCTWRRSAARARCRRGPPAAEARLHRVRRLPGADDRLARAAHRLRVGADHRDRAEVVQDVLGGDRRRRGCGSRRTRGPPGRAGSGGGRPSACRGARRPC